MPLLHLLSCFISSPGPSSHCCSTKITKNPTHREQENRHKKQGRKKSKRKERLVKVLQCNVVWGGSTLLQNKVCSLVLLHGFWIAHQCLSYFVCHQNEFLSLKRNTSGLECQWQNNMQCVWRAWKSAPGGGQDQTGSCPIRVVWVQSQRLRCKQ